MSARWLTTDDLGNDFAYSEYADEAIETASYLMWAMSGRKYSGETTVTERYVCKPRNYRLGGSSMIFTPVLMNGDVYNVPVSRYGDFTELLADGVSPESRVHLRGRPVTRIHAVRSGSTGELIDPSSYYLVDHSTIHVTSGTSWTPCNVEVTYSYGSAVPAIGKMAAKTLATELIKLWTGDDDCALPQRVTSVTRQGVSYTILDNQDFIQELRTGLYAVDLFIKTSNPDGARMRSKVFSPDTPRARRYTTKPLALTANPQKDITVPRDGTATKTMTIDLVGADFLLTETGWTLTTTIRNWSGSKTAEAAVATVLDTDDEELTVTVGYGETVRVLGLIDPGKYDVYATRPNQSNPQVNDVVLVVQGNVKVNMAS